MRHNNYNLPLRRRRLTQLKMTLLLLFFQLSNDDGINEMQSIEPEIHSIVNETGERLKEGNEKGYLSLYMYVNGDD